MELAAKGGAALNRAEDRFGVTSAGSFGCWSPTRTAWM